MIMTQLILISIQSFFKLVMMLVKGGSSDLYSNGDHFVCHDLFYILCVFLIAVIIDHHKLNIFTV